MTQVGADLNGQMDEISIGDAHYKDDSEIVPKEINHEYTQKNSVKGVFREFSLFDDIYLYCSLRLFNLKKLKSEQLPKYRIDLTYLDPKPARSSKLAWKWLLRGIAATVASALVIDISVLSGEFSGLSFSHPAMLPVGVLLGTLGFVLILLFYYKSHNTVIYRSYVGRIPLLALSHKPRKKDYREFISVIEEGILNAQSRNGITMRDRLVGEMKDVRRLKDSGVISESAYSRAQAKILKHKAYKS
jgi:hypothetical protein